MRLKALNSIFLWLLLLTFHINVEGQTDFHTYFGKDTSIAFLECDLLGNTYCISQKNDIIKVDSTVKKVLKIKFNQFGEVNRIDLRDPLQPTLFYPTQNRILTTDQYLQLINSLDVNVLGIDQFSLGCLSNDGNYWIYNPQETVIKKVNGQGAILATTNPISQLNIPKGMTIDYIKETYKNLIVVHKLKGISLFDYFGGFIRFVPMDNLKGISIYKNYIVLSYINHKIELFNPELNKFVDVTLQIDNLNTTGSNFEDIKIFNDFVLFYSNNEILKVKFNGFNQ